MKLSTFVVAGLIVVALSAIVPFTVYDRIPDPMPTHWNLRGEVDGYTAKPWGVILGPLVMAFVLGVFVALRRIAPVGYRLESFERPYFLLGFATILFLAIATSFPVMHSLGWNIRVDQIILGGLGALLMFIGNMLGKTTRNFFVGIRTPWTLANEEVWLRTHRLGGKSFFAAGVLLLIAAFTGLGFAITIPVILLAALIPVVYSYLIYRKLQRTEIPSN